MSQQQEPSLPKLKAVQAQFGHHEAIKQAALWIDGMTDEMGRMKDLHFSVILGSLLWGAACGVCLGLAIGWWKWA